MALTLPRRCPAMSSDLAARGESLAAFDGRCIPAGCVAPRSNTPGILGRRALPSGRLARLGATPDFHHGLLTAETAEIAETYFSLRAPRALRFLSSSAATTPGRERRRRSPTSAAGRRRKSPAHRAPASGLLRFRRVARRGARPPGPAARTTPSR